MSPGQRFAAWIYTGPVGHLYGTLADVVALWLAYLGRRIAHIVMARAGLDA